MSGGKPNPGSFVLKNEELEKLAQAAGRVLATAGKAQASQYIFSGLEQLGLYDMANPKNSKLNAWEVHAIAGRALWVSENVEAPAATETFHVGARLHEVERIEDTLPNLRDLLLTRGFDGKIYYTVSRPIGRQRKTFHGLYYRNAKTGEFVAILN